MPTSAPALTPEKEKRLVVSDDSIVITDTGKPFLMFSRRNLKAAVADAFNELLSLKN